MLKGRRVVYHKLRYLELQERCETLLENFNREVGDNGKQMNYLDWKPTTDDFNFELDFRIVLFRAQVEE